MQPNATKESAPEAKIKYGCTLFNFGIKGVGGFYGRTVITEDQNPDTKGAALGTVCDVNREEFLFLHTQAYEATSVLVVEVILEVTFRFKRVQSSLGYAICDIFGPTRGSKAVQIRSDTPRLLSVANGQGLNFNNEGTAKFKFSVHDVPSFKVLKQLVPDNCLVDRCEVIPGVSGDYFPLPRATPTDKLVTTSLALTPNQKIYIHNMRLSLSPGFESAFMAFLQEKTLMHSNLSEE